jgi:hypothetical protein
MVLAAARYSSKIRPKGPVPTSFQINSAIMTGAIDPEAPRPEVDGETE